MSELTLSDWLLVAVVTLFAMVVTITVSTAILDAVVEEADHE